MNKELTISKDQQNLTLLEVANNESEAHYIFPEELIKCKELFDWLVLSEAKVNPVATLVSLLTITSSLGSRKVYTETMASTSLFIILIAKTGSGKNTVAKAPAKVLEIVNQENMVIVSKISSEGAMDDIFKEQAKIIQIVDEFGDQLAHMLNDSGGYLRIMAAKIKTLYSSTDSFYSPGRYSSSGGKNSLSKQWTLKRPCYGITGITTLVQLLQILNENMLHDGFLNRFIILNGDNIKSHNNKMGAAYDIPAHIIEHIESLEISMLHDLEDDNIKIIPLSDDAKIYYYNFIGDVDEENTDIYNYCLNDESDIKRAMSIRWRENAIRLATSLAFYEKHDSVSLSTLEFAYNIIKKSSIDFLKIFEKESSETIYEKLKQKAIRWFSKEENKNEWHSLSYLARSARPFSSLKSRDRKNLLDDLCESGILIHRKLPDNNTKSEYKLYKN